jgi:hypothetical protein
MVVSPARNPAAWYKVLKRHITEKARAMPAGNDALSVDDAELNDDEISLLCDVGDTFPATLTAAKQARLESLIARGFIETAPADKAPSKYQLTAKANKILTARGVGLNEA